MKDYFVSAIIVAAGSSTRMGDGINKQFLMIDELPVIARSILAFERNGEIDEIIVVAKSENLLDIGAMAEEFGFAKLREVVAGGQTRQQSVAKGIGCAAKDAAYYIIHDGARPLVGEETIANVIEGARRYGAAAAAVPVKDTVKRVDQQGFIAQTPDRSSLYLVQTPQMFRADLYRQALSRAEHDGVSLTDDCQLFEREGYPVYLAAGDYANIKITTPEDLAVARALVRNLEQQD